MRTVISAAHAPAQPSGQDLKVAAEAQQKMSEAQQELSEENTKENNQKLNKHESSATSDKTVQIQTVQIMPLHWTLKLSLRVPKFLP